MAALAAPNGMNSVMSNQSGMSVSMPGMSTSTRFELCVQTLMDGCVNAFVELYELSHRPAVCVNELSQKMFSITDDDLATVQASLMQEELSRRRADFDVAYEPRLQLAHYFEDNGDINAACDQLKEGLERGIESMDRHLEGRANKELGLFYERQKQWQQAANHHETHLRLAEITRDEEEKKAASQNLIRVYVEMGQQCETSGEFEEARERYEKAMNTSKACGDTTAEAQAYSKLGDITVLLGDLHKALEYQKRFLLVSKQNKNGHSEAVASCNVAKLQEELGMMNDAIQSLKHSLNVAETANDLPAICSACKQLGDVYQNSQQYTKAVHYLKEYFRVACDIGDPQLIEQARVSLGLARGNNYMSCAGDRGFVAIACNDIQRMLKWKASEDL